MVTFGGAGRPGGWALSPGTLVCCGEYVPSPLECAMHAACLQCCVDRGYGDVARGLLTQGTTWVDRTPLSPHPPHPAGALDGVGGS